MCGTAHEQKEKKDIECSQRQFFRTKMMHCFLNIVRGHKNALLQFREGACYCLLYWFLSQHLFTVPQFIIFDFF